MKFNFQKISIFLTNVLSPKSMFWIQYFGTNQCREREFLGSSQWPNELPFSKGDNLKSVYKWNINETDTIFI